MKPTVFKRRFAAAFPALPPGVDYDPAEFFRSPSKEVEKLDLDAEDGAMLHEVGFPADAPPFLSFEQNPRQSLQPLDQIDRHLGPEFARYRYLGHNGSGDPICLDERSGAVVYLNHDREMERVLINTSVSRFAECLCLYAEFHFGVREGDFLDSVREVDEAAVSPGGMWSEWLPK